MITLKVKTKEKRQNHKAKVTIAYSHTLFSGILRILQQKSKCHRNAICGFVKQYLAF
ncbi:hypothetical protein HCCG_01943 [Helicobacter cinaedi CCUG 18818 = ATCC BAA-847]|uniref:Uncharacterized protein n=1 Tax=Helicobacter cinaedi CCUG 18818 = ATCC BAA-847 TaxID=537971 RepID=A0ABN0BCZ8_9HELI|nr:hypothetical protein HCCG_01943 [Helicobacter cinaedi CCUG 18818 = ATCC BAA-847]BBB19092.1 hypothetical protein HC081234_02690 [Helicobacter cinaedi]